MTTGAQTGPAQGAWARARAAAASPPLPLLLAAAAVAGAVAIRLAVLAIPGLVPFEADEAVTGLMAQFIISGDDIPAFFAGQAYMGSLEQFLQAGVLAVADDTAFTLRIVQALLAGATAAAVYALGARVTASRFGGALAAGIFALGPWFNVVKGAQSHGAYAAGALLGALGLVLALRLDPEGRRGHLQAAALGLVAGLAAWELWIAAYLLIPALLYALGRAGRRSVALAPAFVAGALLGAAPLIAHRIANGLDTPLGSGTPPPTTAAQRADGLLDPVAEMFLGVGRLGTGEALATWLVPAFVVAIGLGALGAAVWRRRRGLLALVTLRRGAEPVDALLLAFLVAPLIYVASDFSWYTGTPRYLFSLYPAFAALVAAGAMAVPRHRLAAAAATLAVVAGLSAWNAVDARGQEGGAFTIVGGGRVNPDDAALAADELARRGVTAVFADYWLAYPLAYFSEGRIAARPFTNSRFPDLDAAVGTDPSPAYAAPAGPAADQLEAALRAAGVAFQRSQVASVVLFTDVTPRRNPRELGLV